MSLSHRERHRTERVGWLRATVLGANDGILSTANLVLGVAAAHATHSNILLAGVAGLVCAYRLTQEGHVCDVYERWPGLGGQAATLDVGGGVLLERYYHQVLPELAAARCARGEGEPAVEARKGLGHGGHAQRERDRQKHYDEPIRPATGS